MTGEPYTGELPVWFGGRGVSNQWDVPTPIVVEAASGILTQWGNRKVSGN